MLKLNETEISERDKVLQYTYNTASPFDVKLCADVTNIKRNTVANYLNIFTKWGLLKRQKFGNKRVYVRLELTPKLQAKIKLAKMREAADFLHKHSLYLYFAGAAMAWMMTTCSGGFA
jgi:DNA-binding MarR family transcriptional regulator